MQAVEPSQAVLDVGATLAAASQRRYRQLVWDEPQFYEYFRAVTPIDVIERMQIAARPASRPGRDGIDALRAVPWVFAWTQTRALLPGWFGAGAGLAATLDAHGLAGVQEAFAHWPFFRSLVEDVEAMLARADLEIAAAYDGLAPAPLQRFFAALREEHALARRGVLAITQQAELLDGDRTLQRGIQLRSPYVDPMNLMQVDLLRRWRASDRTDRDLFDALQASISGIAQGLQSTG